MKNLNLIALLCCFSCAPAASTEQKSHLKDDTSHLRELLNKEPFGQSWKLPEEFTLHRLEQLVQKFSDQEYGRAFRVIGDERDWFHGHVQFTQDRLTRDGRLTPFAILYHTQEEAYGAHWRTKNIDPKFDYIDVRTRNWVQWLSDDAALDGTRIINARDYLNVPKFIARGKWDPQSFFGENIPVKGEHYTIHGKHLDPVKMSVKSIGEMQWEFYERPCDFDENQLNAAALGIIRVTIPDQGLKCLEVLTLNAFWTF